MQHSTLIKPSLNKAVDMCVMGMEARVCAHRVGMLHRPVAHAIVGPPELDKMVVAPGHEQDVAPRASATVGVHFVQ